MAFCSLSLSSSRCLLSLVAVPPRCCPVLWAGQRTFTCTSRCNHDHDLVDVVVVVLVVVVNVVVVVVDEGLIVVQRAELELLRQRRRHN